MCTRRDFLQLGASGVTAAVVGTEAQAAEMAAAHNSRRFHFVQIDVFAPQRLQGNPLAVFTDARGLSDLFLEPAAFGGHRFVACARREHADHGREPRAHEVPRDDRVAAEQVVDAELEEH